MANNNPFGAWVPFRVWVMALAAAAALVALIAALLVANAPAGAASDRLPDLRMARLQSLDIEKTADGRKLLRFHSVVVNVGAGPFELHGERADTTTDMTVTQRIFDDAGGYRDDTKEDGPTKAAMYFGGDGHNHWHVRDLEDYALTRLDNGVKVGTGAKHGFCFFDNYPFGSSQSAYYSGCGSNSAALEQSMGLSRGWGDIYRASLPDQYIDVTGLTPGNYKLQATADADDWFWETREANNFTWVDIRISRNSVSVIRWGPGAQPI